MRTKALTAEDRQDQIVIWFAIRLQHDNHEPATRYQIARGLGLSPSSHLNQIIDGLVPSILEKIEITKSGRWKGFAYRLAKETYTTPKKNRSITVNSSRGISQLELI